MGASSLTKLKVGLTTILGILILFSGILWVKNYNPAVKKNRMTVSFRNGGGIAKGDPVEISGIKVGEVIGVSLGDDNKALVSFYMSDVTLHPDCSLMIRDVGLMGDKALVVDPGQAAGEIDHNSVIEGMESHDMSSLMIEAGEIVKSLKSVSKKIDENLDVEKLSTEFEQTFEKLRQALAVYEEIALENKKPLNNSLNNLESATSTLKQFVETNDNRLEQAIDSFRQTSDRMSVFVGDLDNISTVVDTLAAYMGTREGTMARLLKHDDLYEEIRQTNAHIDSFVTDFSRNPGKYTKDMKFKVRLF